jgi:protein required for attachment to host cells
MHTAELGDDRPARTFDSGTGLHQPITPKQDLHEREKQRFAEHLARELNRESASGAFGRFVLVAPTRTASFVHAQLDPATRDKLVGMLQKDLIHVPDHALVEHLDRWAQGDGFDVLREVAPRSKRIDSTTGKEVS